MSSRHARPVAVAVAVGALALVAAAPGGAGAAASHADVKIVPLAKKRHPGGVVVREERVTIGARTSTVFTVTMPRPGRGRSLEPFLPEDQVSDGTATTSAVSRKLGRTGTAVVVNADLFEYASGQPSGLLLRNGEIFNQPQGGRPALAISAGGRLSVSSPKAVGALTLPGGKRVPFEVNVRRDDGIVSYDGGWGARAPRGATHSLVARVRSGEFVRRSSAWLAEGRLTAVASGPRSRPIPSDAGPRMLFNAYGKAGRRLAAVREGRPLDLRYRLAPIARDAHAAIGGGPMLIRGGKIVYRRAANREFSDSQLVPPDARTAVAQLRDGRVVFYAVDDVKGSDGFTVPEVARDLHARGARTAMAFDSGGSTAISIDGRLLNDPSDGVERPVGNMLVYYHGDRAHRAPIGAVHVGRPDPGQRVPPLSLTLKRAVRVSVDLNDPKGRVLVVDGTRRRAKGTHAIELPRDLRPGRWKVEVTAPDDRDRVVKAFVVRKRPVPRPQPRTVPVADAGDMAAAAERPASPTAAVETTSGGAGLATWGAIGGGLLLAGGVAAVVAGRRRS